MEYYIYTRTKQEDFVLKQVEVLIDAPEKAKKLCHILSGHKGAFDLAKGRYIVDGNPLLESVRWICRPPDIDHT